MRKTAILTVILLLVLGWGCKSVFAPAANIVLDGEMDQTYTDYGYPQFEGYLRNIGNDMGCGAKIIITCYLDAKKTMVIDTARGCPGDIGPGERAYFSAICFNLTSHDQIGAFNYKIIWINK